ncbi:MAG: transposase [Bacteroidota bacterium]
MRSRASQEETHKERTPSPSRLIMDSQSVKTANKGASRGFDGEIKGRKRQVIVDTQGNVHQVLVHGANV